MTEHGPAMKAAHLQSSLEALSLLGAAAQEVRAQLPAEVIFAIEESPPTAWLPLALDVELSLAIAKVCGKPAVRSWATDSMMVTFKKPLFRGLLSALRLFGLTPSGITKLGPRGWEAIYRDCGHLERKAISATTVELVLHHAPEEMLTPVHVEGIAGAFDVAVRMCAYEGGCEVVSVDAKQQQVVYRVAWQAA